MLGTPSYQASDEFEGNNNNDIIINGDFIPVLN
jgi:hypothetical protein